ncbi:uncharacterized protein LOC111897119 [Lactuca sativa]|uniref:uncharacterized protein LOC111897119 n=1 Tax=Lactuca sativa TaxID=4236 RepID=UPI000CD98042|nr:uncharacterized protein LOC111897119 [Lactuca sativa]
MQPFTQTQPQFDPNFDPFDFDSQPEFAPQAQLQPQISISECEPEFVPQTQPSQPGNKRKEKAESKLWEPQEVLVLAQSWIDVSEDVKMGRNQIHDRFWMQIRARFHKGMNLEPYRNKHQVYSKWGKINKNFMLFNDLYNMKRQWKNCESDEVILEKAFNIYQKEQKNTFKFFEVWNLLKGNKKWQNLKTSDEHINNGSKQSRTSESEHTSSDARVGFDLNKDESVQVSPPPTNGKGQNKKQRQRKSIESRKQRDNNLSVLSMDTSNLTGDALQVVLQIKEDVKKRYTNLG